MMENYEKNNINVLELFDNNKLTKICAPMVRYSKLQFRNLVKKYGCDLCFTPMILADSFCKSSQARNNEFTTNSNDTPLITQFAANTVHDFVGAAYMVSPYCNGVDLNCGCPQRWAKQQGLGCIMLEKPELIYDLVRQCRNHITKPFTVSVKMRIMKDLKKSVEICKQLEHTGVSFLTVHARTSKQLTGDINVEALKLITENVNIPIVANGGIKTLEDYYGLQETVKCKGDINVEALKLITENVNMPVIANGGIKTLEDCCELQETVKSKGVMVANKLLSNPTLFAGSNEVTEKCIQDWLNICYNTSITKENYYNKLSKEVNYSFLENSKNLTFQCFHHHLVFMLEKVLSRREKQVFNNLQSFYDVLNFIYERFNISPQLFDEENYSKFSICDLDYSNRDCLYKELKPPDLEIGNDIDLFYDCNQSNGQFFNEKISCNAECDWSNIFLETN